MILFVSVWPKVVSIAGGFGVFIMVIMVFLSWLSWYGYEVWKSFCNAYLN
ncbi:hypothetical protein E5E24_05750 [Helicobacter pylori]|nr:hypothetical protein E5E24_05750 [Helicobacter pylori]